MSLLPHGQRDYSTVRLSRHALERFIERFAAEPGVAANEIRGAPCANPAAGPQPAERGDRGTGALPQSGSGGDRAKGDVHDRAHVEPVPASARGLRPGEAAAEVGAQCCAG